MAATTRVRRHARCVAHLLIAVLLSRSRTSLSRDPTTTVASLVTTPPVVSRTRTVPARSIATTTPRQRGITTSNARVRVSLEGRNPSQGHHVHDDAVVDTTRIAASTPPPPIVYSIAGSDSGGGAGIQADILTIHDFRGHACTAVTCLTAQSSTGVDAVHIPPVASFFRPQLATLRVDLPPVAIKIGMLGTRELAEEVGRFLSTLPTRQQVPSRRPQDDEHSEQPPPPRVWVVLDPVMISTSGHRLLDDDHDVTQAMREHIFPYVDLLTPNRFEAEALLGGRALRTRNDVVEGARQLLRMGLPAVLIKGGHSLTEEPTDAFQTYAQDYFRSRDPADDEDQRYDDGVNRPPTGQPRLCDGSRGVWLRSVRYDTIHTHGTGCTLSSAIASALALGETARRRWRRMTGSATTNPAEDEDGDDDGGATLAMGLVDACCLAKAYVSAGIAHGGGLGQGPGPVTHTGFPNTARYFPAIVADPGEEHRAEDRFPVLLRQPTTIHSDGSPMDASEAPHRVGAVMPIVDSLEWVQRLCDTDGIADIQLRVKDVSDPEQIKRVIQQAQSICQKCGVHLWINDHWRPAVDARCYGVHLGQEDLLTCLEAGGLAQMRAAGTALGLSVHSYGELATALGVQPSYISLGPIFATTSKNVKFHPQGIKTVSHFRNLIPHSIPLVTIGGIGDAATAAKVRQAGADCVAVIGALTKHGIDNRVAIQNSVDELNKVMHVKVSNRRVVNQV